MSSVGGQARRVPSTEDMNGKNEQIATGVSHNARTYAKAIFPSLTKLPDLPEQHHVDFILNIIRNLPVARFDSGSASFWLLASRIRQALSRSYYKVQSHFLPPGSRRRAAAARLINLLRRLQGKLPSKVLQYDRWIKQNEPGPDEIECQRRHRFPYEPRISILVPVYDPSPEYLQEMFESVIAQSYAGWELCVADGNSQRHGVRELLEEYARRDERIRVNFLPENRGIAGNSNAAWSLASGEYIAMLDHDDALAPFALFEIVRALNQNREADFLYSDEDFILPTGTRFGWHFKPSWSPDTLRSHNYICHLMVLEQRLMQQIGGFRDGFEGSQDYDLALRATEAARTILHVPRILYHWRIHPKSFSGGAKLKIVRQSARKAIAEHMKRQGNDAAVLPGLLPHTHQAVWRLAREPLVSIIIPTQDECHILERCLKSIARSTYGNYEILLVENRSRLPKTFAYYKTLADETRIRLIKYDRPFNYPALNNYAAAHARGEVLVLLNNDTEVITPDWLQRMLEHAQRPDVGAVGAKLYYPDGTIQHGGIILGVGDAAGHAHRGFPRTSPGYVHRLAIIQNLSAVTGACLMVRTGLFHELGGLDEAFSVALNDVDFCLRLRRQGYWIVWTPHAELYHFESKSRGRENTRDKQWRFLREAVLLHTRWHDVLQTDPFYNPNLTMDHEGFGLRCA